MKTKTAVLITIISIFLFTIIGLSTQDAHTQQGDGLTAVNHTPAIINTTTFTPTDWIYLPIIQVPLPCDYTTDDFSDVNSGWAIDNTAFGQWEYINSEYRIASYQPLYVIRAMTPLETQENYTVEADVRWNAAPTNGFHGLIFGADSLGDDAQYYFFVVYTSTGKYRLFRRSGIELIPLTDSTVSAAINTETAVNHLAVSRQGNDIELYINGTKVHQLSDSTLTGPTYTGLAMLANPNNPVADARFDNFKITGCVASTPVSTRQQQAPIVDAVDMIWE